MHFLKNFKFWFPVAFYSGIIFCVSSIPKISIPWQVPGVDKFFHLLEYLPFGFFSARAFLKTKTHWSKVKIIIWGVFFSFVYGLSDEYHQTFVIGRTFDFSDLLADTLGGFLGGYIFLSWQKRKDIKE